MVEPPGIAPGSGPLITSAFIAIVRANPNKSNIGTISAREKACIRGRCDRSASFPPLRCPARLAAVRPGSGPGFGRARLQSCRRAGAGSTRRYAHGGTRCDPQAPAPGPRPQPAPAPRWEEAERTRTAPRGSGSPTGRRRQAGNTSRAPTFDRATIGRRCALANLRVSGPVYTLAGEPQGPFGTRAQSGVWFRNQVSCRLA